jgi:hypothetical protein
VLAVTFFAVLVFAAGQKALYVDLLRGLIKDSSGHRGEDWRAARVNGELDAARVDNPELH